MADFDTLGKALQIPDNVIKNIDAIDKKINQIATDSDNMAKVFTSAMTRMGNGSDNLLKKLQSIQNVINGLGNVNIGGLGSVSKGIGNTATQAEKAAASISEAAAALNKFNQTWKGSGQVTKRLDSLATREQVNLLRELNNQAMQTSRTITQVNRENALSAKQRANETKIASQEETNATNRKMAALKQENAQIKINSSEYRNYVSALTMSESSENSRLKKIERMNTVLSELQRKEALYSNEIEITRKKIEQLARENESLARVRDKASKQRTDERTNTQALNAYNRAMASSEALVTQRINKIAKLRQAEEMLRNASGNYATQLNRISQEIARLNRLNEGQVDSYGRVIRSQRNLVNTSQQLTRQLALIFSVSQIEGYISKLIRVRGEFELQQTALASILQNKDQADQLFAQITELAVKSPFTVKELTTYTKSLSAYQVEYEKLYDTTKMLADVSAGLGVDMQRLILAFGQVKAANILRGTEVRQFTEAGLNILGELAKYYSELEGRMISVGEVQDMVTKRMVSFGDVEEVFKRVTSAGGIFYNMQERQAETLAGQMSNLQDQIDLMFNEIGKQNQGSLNTAISIIKAVIENWEILANILQSAAIGWTVYAAKTLLAAAANKAFSSSAIVATRDMKGLTGMTAKVITSMRSFFSVLKANPIAIIATVVTSAVIAWNKHKKAVEENIKSYDPMVNSVSRAKEELSDLAGKITEQNEKLNEAVNNVSKYKKGTDEYVTAEISANKEREKQNQLLNELKTKYPEIYTGISKQINGNEELTKVLQEQLVAYGYVLEQQQYLSYLGRQTATGEDNGILKNIQQATEATNATKTASENVDFAYKQMLGRINEFFATNTRVSDSFKDTINGIINSTESADDKISKLLTSIYGFEGSGVFNIGDLRRSIDRTGLEDIVSTYRDAEDLRKKELEELEKDIAYITKEYLRSYDTTTSEGLKNAEEAATKYVKSLNIHNQEVLDFAKQQFEVKLGISIDLKEIPAELGIVEKRINDYLDKNQFNLIERIKPGEGMEKFFKELQDNLKTYKSELEKYQSATGQLSPEFTNEEMIDQYNAKIKQVSETLNYWGYAIKEKNNDSKTELDILKEQLKIIKQVVDAYNKYKQYMSEGEASSLAKQLADGTVAKDIVGTLSLDTSELIEGLELFSKEAFQRAKEAGQKAVDEVIRDYKEKNIIEIEVKGIEEAKERVSSIFQSYEFSLDLNTKGIDASEFRNMLKSVGATDAEISFMGLDVTTFKEAQEKLRSEILELQKQGGSEQLDAAMEIQKQLTDLEVREATKRFDELLALREKYQSAEKKISDLEGKILEWNIEIDAIKTIQEIDGIGDKFEATQKEYLELQVQNAKDMILQLKSEALQLTEFWQNLFGDLGELSLNSVKDIMRQRDEIIANATPIKNSQGETSGYSSSFIDAKGQEQEVQMTIGQYNQLIKAYKKLKDEYRQRNPLGNFVNSIIEGRKEGESFRDFTTRLTKDFDELATESLEVANSILEISNASDEAMQKLQGAESIVKGFISVAEGIASENPLAIFSGLVSVIGGINKIADSNREQEIKNELEAVNELERAYSNLQYAIENGLSINAYNMQSQVINNLMKQIKSYQAMIEAERDKKNTDKDRINEWKDQINSLYQEISDTYRELTTQLIGDFKSMAQTLGDSLVEALKRGEDAGVAFGDTMKDVFLQVLQNAFQMSVLEPLMEDLANQMNEMMRPKSTKAEEQKQKVQELQNELNSLESRIDNTGFNIPQRVQLFEQIELKEQELAKAQEKYNQLLKDSAGEGIRVPSYEEIKSKFEEAMGSEQGVLASEWWKLIEQFIGDYFPEEAKGDNLTGLSKSISGITETQADALQSILESMRWFVSDENATIHNIFNWLLNTPAETPLMQQLSLQSQRLGMIYDLWNSVIKSVPSSGRAIKVQIV